jgi:hypothetical protein
VLEYDDEPFSADCVLKCCFWPIDSAALSEVLRTIDPPRFMEFDRDGFL